MADEKVEPDDGANARRMQAERAACEGISTEALESGVIELTRDALEAAWAWHEATSTPGSPFDVTKEGWERNMRLYHEWVEKAEAALADLKEVTT